jgi:hypothetical protein
MEEERKESRREGEEEGVGDCDCERTRAVPSFVRNVSKNFMNMFAQQHATWINGPSLPSHNPDATARH